MCSCRQCASNDMQHDPLRAPWVTTWPWPEVKFQVDLSRSTSTSFDASRREKHDGATPKSVSFLDKKLWAKNFWAQKWPFVTSQVTKWPRTLKKGTNRFVSWRPTRSFLSRSASSIRGQTRGGGGSYQPPPPGRPRYEKGPGRARVKIVQTGISKNQLSRAVHWATGSKYWSDIPNVRTGIVKKKS